MLLKNQIYNHSKVKAMVSLTKGEGFGRPLLEFSLTNKPIITTNWSGHIDYLNPEFTTLLPGTMTKVHESAANHMLMKEAEWFSVTSAPGIGICVYFPLTYPNISFASAKVYSNTQDLPIEFICE